METVLLLVWGVPGSYFNPHFLLLPGGVIELPSMLLVGTVLLDMNCNVVYDKPNIYGG